MDRQIQLVESVIQTEDLEVIRREADNLDKINGNFGNSYNKFLELSHDAKELSNFDEMVQMDEKVFNIKHNICSWFIRNNEKSSSRSSSTKSKGSSKSYSSHKKHTSEKSQL